MSQSPPESTSPQGGAPAAGASPSSKPAPVRILPVDKPVTRPLNVYAFDPSFSIELHYAGLNCVTLKVPWEYDPVTGKDILKPGPVGEYVEVVDIDPASDCCYAPVDLNRPYLLASDGLLPLERNPQFHQQMVYAVAMTTINNFERALGRRILWAPRRWKDPGQGGRWHEEYVPRLRIYPHALREANAFYSPPRKALLFGYFPASLLPEISSRTQDARGIVFTCLSQDIIAHETTHAILDGLHPRFTEASNPDVLAFHEAFADIVALFQHFSLPEVLRDQIARTGGNLSSENLLAQLAQQFGQATGLYGALRDALGKPDPQTKVWKRTEPDPNLIETTTEPHDRGSLMVAAVFAAFLAIYQARSSKLLRLATGHSQAQSAEELHPDLVSLLAAEAAKTAGHVLTMCVRALDYCPPVDISFGDYLRALVTADHDLMPADEWDYRVAFISAFRQYGIVPSDVRSLSVESLCWRPPERPGFKTSTIPVLEAVRRRVQDESPSSRREGIYRRQKAACAMLHNGLEPVIREWGQEMGLRVGPPASKEAEANLPRYEVHSARPAQQIGPNDTRLTDLVIEITQWRPGYLDPIAQERADSGDRSVGLSDFPFRGGCTLVIDSDTGKVRYCISKRIGSKGRLQRQRDYVLAHGMAVRHSVYFGTDRETAEPFALLHRMIGAEVSS